MDTALDKHKFVMDVANVGIIQMKHIVMVGTSVYCLVDGDFFQMYSVKSNVAYKISIAEST